MNTMEPTFMLLADRPLLGAVALAACLAGGSGSYGAIRPELAGTPHKVDSAGFAPGWEKGAPTAPLAAVAGLQLRLADLQPPRVSVAVPARRDLAEVAEVPHITARAALRSRSVVPPVAVVAPRDAAATAQPIALAAALPAAAAPSAALPGALPLSVLPLPVEQPATADLAVAAVPLPAPLSAAPAATLVPAVQPAVDTAPLKIISTPELRRFDLASFRKPAARPAGKTARMAASGKGAAPTGTKARQVDRLVDDVLYHQTPIMVGGKASGDIAVRIGPDMKPSVKVADLLGLVSAQMDPDALARFTQAGSASEYVSFATLRSAGFEVSYNAAADSIAISAAP
ncbi:MAG: hypothetical protein ACKOQ3_11125 [Novosphingobium sp.]